MHVYMCVLPRKFIWRIWQHFSAAPPQLNNEIRDKQHNRAATQRIQVDKATKLYSSYKYLRNANKVSDNIFSGTTTLSVATKSTQLLVLSVVPHGPAKLLGK